LPFKSEGSSADGTTVGSRLGTHALWTVALSAVITLLALAPMILPGDRPLDSLPAPLRGTAQAGEIVADALTASPPPKSASEAPSPPPSAPTTAANGILGGPASSGSSGGSAAGPDRSGGGGTSGRPGGGPQPPP